VEWGKLPISVGMHGMVATTEVEIIIGMFANLLSEVAVSEGAMAECGIVTALFAVAEV
jgi:hypothetical protein